MRDDRTKRATEWFRSTIFRDERIRPRAESPRERVPSPIRAARALERGSLYTWQPRQELFLKQAKLLVNYEDDYAYERPVTYYFPTYQSLSDPELRAYFTWRTRLRRGELRKTSLSYVFLYIYELLNQVGVTDPVDGYWKLKGFQAAYGQLDDRVDFYLNTWLEDYTVYYGLDPLVLTDSKQIRYDNGILVFQTIPDRSDRQIMETVHELGGQWLSRSKFYRENREDCDRVICRVLREMYLHYAARCKKSLAEHFFGSPQQIPVRLFENAVFCGSASGDREYVLDPLCVYRCENGLWTVTRFPLSDFSHRKLDGLMKAVDGIMRECFGHCRPIKYELDTKWLLKLIRAETEALLAEKKAAQAPRLAIDYTQLEKIRRDSEVTRDKLIVDEEIPEEEPQTGPEPAPPEQETPLSPEEYRLLQCLLYGGGLSWVQTSGLMLSVLADGINEKLYDTFGDTVVDDTPALVEDYIEDLKEMVLP